LSIKTWSETQEIELVTLYVDKDIKDAHELAKHFTGIYTTDSTHADGFGEPAESGFYVKTLKNLLVLIFLLLILDSLSSFD
jgi:hypothetical protein